MDFTIPAPLERLVGELRAFVEAELYPLESHFLHKRADEVRAGLARARHEVKARGWWAPHMPREYGGMGLGLAEFAHVAEVLGKSPLGHVAFHCQAPDAGNMELLLHFGTEAQKEAWLRPLVSGAMRSCFSMTEPEFAGSNPVVMATQAVRDGDHFVIDGHKWFTTAADGADFAVCMAVTDPGASNPYARASQLLVPTDTPGFRLVRNLDVMGEEGEGFSSHGEVVYEGCRVPASNLLGPQGAGFMLAQARLGPGRIHHCMRWIGICERAMDLMCDRAIHRQIAPGKPLATRQLVQAWIAESRAEIHAARLTVLHAAWKIDKEGAQGARVEISAIKFMVAGTLQRVLDRAIQVLGALGMTDQTPLAWWYRHERGARIYDGPDEVHKTVLARHELRSRGFDLKV